MEKRYLVVPVALLAVLVLVSCATTASTPAPTSASTTIIDAASLYASNCAVCHGANRQGLIGPALNKATIGDDSNAEVAGTISRGETEGSRVMPSFRGKLSADQINALVTFIKQP